MPYEFPTDIRDRLQARLAAGDYQSEDELIRAAMNALDQIEADKVLRWHDRNRLALEQSEQGLSRPLDDNRVITQLRERFSEEEIADQPT